MRLTSPSFADGAFLPFDCAYEGENRSPLLNWSDAPAGTRSFALSCVDDEAPGPLSWVHWLMWNIPAAETRRVAGLPPYASLDDGSVQGINDFLEFGWGGPCPPSGAHRYSFKLYALDSLVSPASPRLSALEEAMRGRVLAVAELSGFYAADGALASYEQLGREARRLVALGA